MQTDLQHRNCSDGDVLQCKSAVALTVVGADYSRFGNLQRKLIELETKEDVLLPSGVIFAACGELPRDIDEATSKSVLHVSCGVCTASLCTASRWADRLRS